jgi:hypothetical protein
MQHRLLPFPLALCLCASARAQCELQILPDPPADPAAALTALALSGERALLGIPYEKTDSGLGRVRVLERSGSSWSEVARLEAAGPVDVRAFGYSVALEADRALVGAANESQEGLTYHGAAYVFERAASGSTQVARLLPGELLEGSFFGHTVALEGDEAFVSAPLATLVQHQEGVAYVFSRSGAGWVQSQELRSPRLKASEHYGTALAVQGDTLFVGTNVLFDSSDLGRVYRYQRPLRRVRGPERRAGPGRGPRALGGRSPDGHGLASRARWAGRSAASSPIRCPRSATSAVARSRSRGARPSWESASTAVPRRAAARCWPGTSRAGAARC